MSFQEFAKIPHLTDLPLSKIIVQRDSRAGELSPPGRNQGLTIPRFYILVKRRVSKYVDERHR